MSDSEDSGPGRREVAHRLLAAEFDDSEFSYSESDEERAPNYVVTPTGARVNRLFVVGVLTELEQVNEEVLRARVVDPTGAVVVYAGQYQPEALAFLEGAEPPLFVAVTGKARTFEPEDGDRIFTSIRPESISEVDAETRDRWVVQAAEQTLARVDRMASAIESGLTGDTLRTALVDAGVGESAADGVTLALEYYGTTGDYLQAVRELALNSARVVAGQQDEAGTLSLSPGDGIDDPAAALATMALDAPDEATSSETATAGTETADSSSEPDDTAVTTTADPAGTTAEESTELATTDQSPESADAGEDDVGEFDPEFELDEDEREELESEYGTDFRSGTEVDDAGEAGIETPDPEEPAEAEADAEPATTTDSADSGAESQGADGSAAGDTTDEPAADVALEDAVMGAMEELDTGGGADREAVISTVVDAHGVDREAVEDAIQDALMGGRCYEPDDGKLTPI